MTAESRVPDIEDELERKTIDALKASSDKFSAGLITAETYQEILEALNEAVRGLVSEPIALAIDQERDLAGYSNSQVLNDALYKDSTNHIAVMTVDLTNGKMMVMDSELKGPPRSLSWSSKQDIDQAKDAMTQMRKLRAKFIKKGYRRML